MKIFLKILSIVLLAILCIGALYGSWMLITDPSGNKIRIPIELLSTTPFKDYLIPGVILLVTNGIFQVFIIGLIVLSYKISNWLLIFQGCILIGWLSFEFIFNKDFYMPILHIPLYSIGFLLISIGFCHLRIENKKQDQRQII